MLASVAALPVSWALPGVALTLTANTTALIMGGTFHPLAAPRDGPRFVTDYLDNAVTRHLDPAFAGSSGPVTNAVAVVTPEDFFPIGRLTFETSVAEGLANLHRCVRAGAECVFNADPAVTPGVGTGAPQAGDTLSVFGYSQSAVIASLAKRDLIRDYEPGDPGMSFMLVANPMRPNGGVLMRLHRWPTIPVLRIPFPGASPTDGPRLAGGGPVFPTVDLVRQYDGLGGDFPVRPLNLLATVNALLGYGLLHGETVDVPLRQARFQGHEGDTDYYLVETDLVPLLQPFAPFVPRPILKAIDAPLRVLIEDAYDRHIGPGVPRLMSWRPVTSVIGLAGRLVASIPVAVDNFTQGLGLGRVLRTTEPGTFGVGGPDLPAGASPEIRNDAAQRESGLASGKSEHGGGDEEPAGGGTGPPARTEIELAEPDEEAELAEPDEEVELAEPDEESAQHVDPTSPEAEERHPVTPAEREDTSDVPSDRDTSDVPSDRDTADAA
ncbi:PE-PPE domain-containing protein [Mycobacterium sp. 4D054]|uniref:PE-PPE domain-containing protein n=1 Tax=Mycobacterium sp. 4D054 TaxID=3457440 RepID=UPI003FD0A9C3